MRDATLTTYAVTVYDADAQPHTLPVGGLNWQRQPSDLSMRVGFQVPDLLDADGTWLGSYVANGNALVVSSIDETGSTNEVLRGRIWGRRKGLDGQAPIQVRGYDLLYPLTKSTGFTHYYGPDTLAKDVLTDLCTEFEVPLGRVDGLAVAVGPLRFANKKPSVVLTNLLSKAQQAGDGVHLVRWNGTTLEVVKPGTNTTVYWFVEGESVLGGEEDASAEDLVTRVRIYRTANANPSNTQRDSHGHFVANPDPSPPAELAKLDGATKFGIFQQVVMLKKSDDQDQAIQAAQATLDLKGAEVTTLRLIAPLLPDVLIGDKVRITAGSTDGYAYVHGLSGDVDAGTMQLDTVADPTTFADDYQDTDLTTDDASASDDLPDGLAAAQVGSSGVGPSGSSHWLDVARSALGSVYNFGGPKGRSDMSMPFGPGGPHAPTGSDCSGYVTWVYYNGFGIDLRSGGGSSTFTLLPKTVPITAAQALPGDLVFYGLDSSNPEIQHVAIYIGNGQIIQDGGERLQNVVNIASVNDGPPTYRRVPGGPNG